ncbi:unnamed protein product, partial [Discosporangium mesarthrocarpum]
VNCTCTPLLEGLTLSPRDTVECNSVPDFAVTQDDIDVGYVENRAELKGWSSPPNAVKQIAPDADMVVLPREFDVTIRKESTNATVSGGLRPDIFDAGDTITYEINVKNTGNTRLSSVVVGDTLFSEDDLICTPDLSSATSVFLPDSDPNSLPVGCTAKLVVTAAHMDTGNITSTADVIAAKPDGSFLFRNVTIETLVEQLGEISISLSCSWEGENGGGYPEPGQNVDCIISIENSGTITLNTLGVIESTGAAKCDIPDILGQGESFQCRSSIQLQQADINSGGVSMTAQATGFEPNGDLVKVETAWDQGLESNPKVELGIIAAWQDLNYTGTMGYADSQELIFYSYTIRNTGNVDLTRMSLSDADVNLDCNASTTLGASAQITCKGSYYLSWADIYAESKTTHTKVIAYDPESMQVMNSSTVSVELKKPPSIQLSVSSVFINNPESNISMADVGETVKYELLILNDGHATLWEVTLTDLLIEDDFPPWPKPSDDLSCSSAATVSSSTTVFDGSFTENSVIRCNGTYTLTFTDIDNLEVINEATVTAIDKYENTVSDTSVDALTLKQVGSMNFAMKPYYDKEATKEEARIDDLVHYTINIINGGLLTLYNITIEDDQLRENGVTLFCTHLGQSEAVGGIVDGAFTGLAPYPQNGLPPGDSLECTATDSVSQSEINAGEKLGSAEVQAMYESSPDVLNQILHAEASAVVELTQLPGCRLTKEAHYEPDNMVSGSGLAAVDDLIVYNITAVNTGNLDIYGASLNDDMFEDAAGSDVECPEGVPPDPWLVGASFECGVTYSITQADIDAGSVLSMAVVTGYIPNGNKVEETAISSQILERMGDISMAVNATLEDDDGIDGHSAGDHVRYDIYITNNGTTTLDDIEVMDWLPGKQFLLGEHVPRYTAHPSRFNLLAAEISCGESLGEGALSPQGHVDCSVTQMVEQADIDAGSINKTVRVIATSPEGGSGAISSTVTHDQLLVQVSSIHIGALGVLNTSTDGIPGAGDTVEHELVVTNTGNTCLRDVNITSQLSLSVSCPNAPTGNSSSDILCPREALHCTTLYTIDQNDMDAGEKENAMLVTSTSPTGEVVTAMNSTSLSFKGIARVQIVKDSHYTPTSGGMSAVGENITYALTVSNTGTISLVSVAPVDMKVGNLSCTPDVEELGPGSTAKCNGMYYISQEDIDAGMV